MEERRHSGGIVAGGGWRLVEVTGRWRLRRCLLVSSVVVPPAIGAHFLRTATPAGAVSWVLLLFEVVGWAAAGTTIALWLFEEPKTKQIEVALERRR